MYHNPFRSRSGAEEYHSSLRTHLEHTFDRRRGDFPVVVSDVMTNVPGLSPLSDRFTPVEVESSNESRAFTIGDHDWTGLVKRRKASGWTEIFIAAATERVAEGVLEECRSLLAVQYDDGSVNLAAVVQDVRGLSRLRTEPFDQIIQNYPDDVAHGLKLAMAGPPHDRCGRLMVWHGPPGTGKTTAARSLLGAFHDAGYELEVHLGESRKSVDYIVELSCRSGETGRRLIVIEEGGGLIRKPKSDGMGRQRGERPELLKALLDAGDGILGFGSNVHVLITTNLPASELDLAALRPGRCWSLINFRNFSRAEAGAWLGRSVDRDHSLAELMELRRGGDVGGDDANYSGLYN